MLCKNQPTRLKKGDIVVIVSTVHPPHPTLLINIFREGELLTSEKSNNVPKTDIIFSGTEMSLLECVNEFCGLVLTPTACPYEELNFPAYLLI